MFRLDLIRREIIGLAITTFIAIVLVSGIAGYILYQTSITQTTQRLSETAQSNARLIESFAINNLHQMESHH
ncbi:MAG: hypothetical protein ABW100_00935, partial [Candidatus Thiodiazotropha sp. 6PLUC3]